MGKSKKKNKTQKVNQADDKIPKSFVIHRGIVTPSCMQLMTDVRQILSPYTATNLKVNVLPTQLFTSVRILDADVIDRVITTNQLFSVTPDLFSQHPCLRSLYTIFLVFFILLSPLFSLQGFLIHLYVPQTILKT